MSKKTKKNIVFVGTESDMLEDIFEKLRDMSSVNPLHLQFGDTPEGVGLYACDESFTLDEAEKAFEDNLGVTNLDEDDDLDVPFDPADLVGLGDDLE